MRLSLLCHLWISAALPISILVKNPDAKEHGKIFIHDIGDYLSQKDKLNKIENLKSINSITKNNLWEEITPDEHNDWLNQRDDSFEKFIKIGDKNDKKALQIFKNYSAGLLTSRDVWCYRYC